ncbi:hypothetical protein PHSY_004047 [Pseudozyma hubeiensis SY62]|uniref:Uncharacterized protein n=1 Tax=Pseudozyma hubeiensis (strain SY62) TaxID=1305764 RepID=R9P5F8_PSEHS|nr:hypothetical protein PHSY_004047 [Pseudozyma hubeiensis SY62]GAC96467.1 hypothetical protein PHSY_004047 [Pseudozyma hubeiensis SY62]
MDEDLLKATDALCLSPHRDRLRGSAFSRHICRGRDKHVKNSDSNHFPEPSSDADVDDISPSIAHNGAPLPTYFSMPRGVKRPRRGSEDATSHIDASSSPSKVARHNVGSNACEPILISDSDDDRPLIDGQRAVEEALEDSPTASHRQKLASLYTYHSPTKARAVVKPRPGPTVKSEIRKSELSTEEPSTVLSSSRACFSTPSKTESSTSTLLAKSPLPLPIAKDPKKAKRRKRETLQLKKTLQDAKERDIVPLELDRVSAAGFRLILRCSFCAGAFAKSTSAKAKQEHMSLCAPLQGIVRSQAAVDTISSDISNLLRRDEQDKKKAADERTVLQDVMHDADIIMHEGRASQIATSTKKRGRDKVVTKKRITRVAKPTVLVVGDHSSKISPVAHSAGHNLLPARKAMLAARDFTTKMLGSAISFLIDPSESGESEDPKPKSDPDSRPVELMSGVDVLATPRKNRIRRELFAHNADGTSNRADQLPAVNAEQVFASMASVSPEKSPVKALQKSRQRQLSKDQDLSLQFDGTRTSPASPSPPQTQPFAPSKLAQRQQARCGKARDQLFGAETTTRSLLDLMQEAKAGDSDSSKRKADELDQTFYNDAVKRSRKDEENRDPTFEARSASSKRTRGMKFGSILIGASEGQDMDLDDHSITSPSPLPEKDSPGRGKLQDQMLVEAAQVLAHESASTDDIDPQVSSDLQQKVSIVRSDQEELATRHCDDEADLAANADSLEEDVNNDDDDSQSFLDLLEPLDIINESDFPQTQHLSDPSSDDMDDADSGSMAIKNRRMLVASGGASMTIEPRRKAPRAASLAGFPASSPSDMPPNGDTKALPSNEARESSVSNSDPDLVLITDDSCTSSPQP